METIVLATGRRKRAVARVRLIPGTGRILVNQKEFKEYFRREEHQIQALAPLGTAFQIRDVDVLAKVIGGGISGQAGAFRLGLARALLKIDPTLHASLKKNGFLTRDPREKERKKYGRRRARKGFQYSKR